jgi:acyl transferase domain-containing protein
MITPAGMPMERIKGSKTAVFAASMSDDYARMNAKDPDNAPRVTIMGIAPSIMANRISWYFDLTGPSIHLDTACSSGMIGLDLACQSIRTREASMVATPDQ